MGKVDKFKFNTARTPIDPAAVVDKEEDRRLRGHRLLVSFPVFMTYQGQLIQGYVEAMNISWSGMLLATNFPLNLGDQIHLEFTLPSMEVPASVNARVIHKRQETIPEEATEIGVLFVELEPNIQRMIAGFVLENLPHDR